MAYTPQMVIDGFHSLPIVTHTNDAANPPRFYYANWNYEPLQRHTAVEDIASGWSATSNFYTSNAPITYPTFARSGEVPAALGPVTAANMQQQTANAGFLAGIMSLFKGGTGG